MSKLTIKEAIKIRKDLMSDEVYSFPEWSVIGSILHGDYDDVEDPEQLAMEELEGWKNNFKQT